MESEIKIIDADTGAAIEFATLPPDDQALARALWATARLEKELEAAAQTLQRLRG